jgi:hypothetical protein
MRSLRKGHAVAQEEQGKYLRSSDQALQQTGVAKDCGTVFSWRFMHCRRFDMGNMHYRGYKSSNDTQLHQKCLQIHPQFLYIACKYAALGIHMVVMPVTA